MRPRLVMRWVATLAGVLAAFAGVPGDAVADAAPPIKHVFIIVLENKSFDQTFGENSAAPYLSLTLPSMGALLPNYYGVTHESMGNYIGLLSGQGSNPITQSDCQVYAPLLPGTIGANGQALGTGCVYPAAVKTVADQLDGAGLSWKGYMEDMGNAPGEAQTCAHPALLQRDPTQSARVGDQYAARHNPFVYFQSLLSSGACARYDVPLSQLPSDLSSASSTPNYSLIIPNLCDDGHDAKCVDGRTGGLPAIDAFLRTWVPKILASSGYQQNGMLLITFDEAVDAVEWAQQMPAGAPPGGDGSSCCGELPFPNTPNNAFTNVGLGGGRTGAVLLSPFTDPGTVDNVAYNHFSMLASTENMFGLSHLGYAGVPGLQTLGSDAFSCYQASTPRASHGRLSFGSEIKSAVIGQGTAARPMVEIKLWHPGIVTVQVKRAADKPRRHKRKRHKRTHAAIVPDHRHRKKHRRRHRSSLKRVGRPQSLIPCQLLKVALPTHHGTTVVSARAFGGVEQRTIRF